MTKLGDEYQDIVGAVEKALDSGAIVKVGQWVKGPDGRRDMDVEVRGIIDGEPKFILVECKDWKKPVGIKEIDALESKRHDLGADDTVIYSNCGFTRDALRKARRVGIGACSAIKAGDGRIKLAFYRQLVVKKLSVERCIPILYFPKGDDQHIEEKWDIISMTYQEAPVVNWISSVSKDILRRHENCNSVIANFAFGKQIDFKIGHRVVHLTGIGFRLECSKKWLTQEVQSDISLGLYDHIRKHFLIPNGEKYILGWIDFNSWEEIESDGWDTPEEGSFEIYLTLLNPVPQIEPKEVPDLDSIIVEREEKCSNPSANHANTANV